ncbi:MAG: hypothetical protein DRN21_03380 [Thermoplasmata archaeon]|nr:MAG: hypothetical protein DRN21_03380 [Thermoplasmata archaeon]
MILGTQYYRPPNPRREDWERDLDMIRAHGIELIRTWMYWSRVNPREGVWTWEEYDHLLNLAAERGLKVLIQLMCDAPPYWFEQKHPETRYLDVNGQPVAFSAKSSQAVGGAPGPCFHHPTARTAAEEFMRRTAKRYLDAPALHAYDLWNEIWMHECFCEFTQAQFRQFLSQKYGDIKNLNTAWQRSYASFEEVRLPREGVYADMIDRYEFEQWSKRELMRWRYQTVRAVDRKHLLVSHYGGHCSLFSPGDDPWLFAEPIDGWGTSSYDTTLPQAALTFHATACASRGKPWWLSEQTGGRTWSHVGDRLCSDAFLRSFHVLAMSYGAEVSIYWQWRPEIFGQESPHFGLTSLSGEPTSRTEMLRQFAGMLQRHKGLFTAMQFSRPQVGILWEPRAIAYEHINQSPERYFRDNFVGWYRAVLRSNVSLEIFNSRIVAEEGIPDYVRLLIAPMQIFDRKGLTPKLEAWVKAGGVLVAGPWYGMYDEYTYANPQVPPTDLFGIRQGELYYLDNPRVELIQSPGPAPWVVSHPTGLTLGFLPGQKFIESLLVEDAEIMGVVDENIVMTSRTVGKGKGLYVGTFLGNVYDHSLSPQLGGFVKWLCEGSGVQAEVGATEGCLIRTAMSQGSRIVFLTNPSENSVTTWLTFAKDEGGKLVDLLTGEVVAEIRKGKPVPVSIEAEDSRVFKVG